jgi:hypothetical protein
MLSYGVTDLLATMRANIAKLPADAVNRLNESMTIDSYEHFAYQTLQSVAYASGRITRDTAVFLHHTLGSTFGVFNGKPLAERMLAFSMLGALGLRK